MVHFFHRLFHVHCEQCREESQCKNCETLRSLLEAEKFEKKQLLDRLIELTRPQEKEKEERREPPRVIPLPTTWRMRKQLLEQEDLAKAQALRKRTEELEKETGIQNA